MKYRFLITLVLLLLAGVAIGPFIQFSNGNLNPFTAIWDTTTAWNGGSFIQNMDTASNSCLASGQGIQLNSTGGNYGVSHRCPTGSPYIGKSFLSESYDMSELSGSGYQDYSGHGYTIYNHGTNSTPGLFGNAAYFDGSSKWIGNNFHGNTADILLANFTLAAWVYETAGQGGFTSNYGTIFAFINSITFSNRFLIRVSDGVALWQHGAGPTTITWTLPVLTVIEWHSIVIVKTFADVSLYVDGILASTQAASGFLSCAAPCNVDNAGGLSIGYDQTGTDHFKGAIDNVVISNRTWTTSEISTFSNRDSTYATFGSWTSQKVQTTNQTPVAVVLGYRNVSGSDSFGPWVSGFSIFNSTTGLEFDSPGVMSTGTYNITYFTVSVFSNGSQIVPRGNLNWTLEIDLQGDGNATAQLFYAAIIFQSLSAPTVTPKFAPTLDTTAIAIFLLLFAFAFLFITGFIERFLMVGAAIVAFIIGVLSWSWTGEPFVPAIFVLVGTACIGLAMVIKPR